MATRVLHVGEQLVLSRWTCPASSPRWRLESTTGDPAFLVALAHRPVGIRHEGRPGVHADLGNAVLYDPGQVYRRTLLHADGDIADILGFPAEVVDEAIGAPSFGVSVVPLSDAAFLGQRRAFATGEPLAMEEAAAHVLAEVAGHLGAREVRTSPAVVDRARRVLAEDLGERLSLAELARRVHASPYHLARVFKAATGSTVHGHREGLRLRAAADRAVAGHRLSEVAADLGFASHSHLTARFRRRFGLPPSALT